MISIKNWQHTHYSHEDLKSLISLCSDDKGELFYSVSTFNSVHRDIYNKDFSFLSDAISHINLKYGSWKMSVQEHDSSGCSTCTAH